MAFFMVLYVDKDPDGTISSGILQSIVEKVV